MSTTVQLVQEGLRSRIQFRSENGIQLLSASVRKQLSEVITEIENDENCRVVIFEAEGRTFIAGADIHELSQLNANSAESLALEVHELFQRIAYLSPVTIAAIHAACAGGGFELSLACDMRMAAASARIGLPEVSLGVIPGWGGTARVLQQFGPAVAKRMILSGELLPATEALQLQIVDSVHPDDAFREAVTLRSNAVLSRSPNACRIAKSLIHSLQADPLEEQLKQEARNFAACFRSPEAAEGLKAFCEKRKPSWHSE
ncbi:MAG: enoyl-CoA hydratase [Planctomycetaceae bacterium]